MVKPLVLTIISIKYGCQQKNSVFSISSELVMSEICDNDLFALLSFKKYSFVLKIVDLFII